MIRWFTAGESHGQGLMIIVEGVPAYLSLDEEYIARHLGRRQRGYGRGGRQLIESDHAHIQTGVRHGYTLGSPIGMSIENKDWANWQEAMAVEYIENPSQEGRNQRVTRIRPGHADLPGAMKYGFHDVRNSLERASRPGNRGSSRRRRGSHAITGRIWHQTPQPRDFNRQGQGQSTGTRGNRLGRS